MTGSLGSYAALERTVSSARPVWRTSMPLVISVAPEIKLNSPNSMAKVTAPRPGRANRTTPNATQNDAGDEVHGAAARGLPAPKGGEHLEETAENGPASHQDHQDQRGGRRPRQGDRTARDVNQSEQQVADDWSGLTAAEGPHNLEPCIHEGIDREQDHKRENRHARPRKGEDPDDQREDAAQDQGCGS